MLLLIATTMRMGELFTLRWQHVDLENRRVFLQTDKANGIEGREVPLSLEGVALFEDLPRVNARVLPFERSAFVEIWKQARSDLGIDDLCLQDLRHDGATRWAKRLRNIPLLQQVTGHRTLAMVQRYVNVPLQDTIDAMDAAMADDPYLRDRPRIVPKVRYSLVQHIRTLPGADAQLANDSVSRSWKQERGACGKFVAAYPTHGKQ
jgi:integrase